MFKNMQNDGDAKLLSVRDELALDLYELEDEYYSSLYKWRDPLFDSACW